MKNFIIGAFMLLTTAAYCDAGPYSVIVFLEAKEDQVETLKASLLSIAEKSRKESTNIEYRVHQDATDPAKFALYETWQSKSLHAKQFEKSYILEFVEQAPTMLAKPFQGLFGSELR